MTICQLRFSSDPIHRIFALHFGQQIAAETTSLRVAFRKNMQTPPPHEFGTTNLNRNRLFTAADLLRRLAPETSRSRLRLTPDDDPKSGHPSDIEPDTSPPVPADNSRSAAVRCTRPT
jgi:hypothetical protein